MKAVCIFLWTFLLLPTLWAFDPNTIYHGVSGQSVTLPNVISQVVPGSVVIVSELHDSASHHAHQLEFLQKLHELQPNLKISVGMEFFEYPDQVRVNQYLGSWISEEEFLKQIGWMNTSFFSFFADNSPLLLNGIPYSFYRPLVQFPKFAQGWVVALNAPRALTAKVAKVGVENLTQEEKKWLPPQFQVGRAVYKERFRWVMGGGHHIPEEKFDRYFQAQSLWDDTMAWQAQLYLQAHPDQVLVIIVGDFHNAYGGGLPDRLKARGVSNVLTLSQVSLEGSDDKEQDELILPHEKWGARADWVWTDDFQKGK